MKDKIKLDKKMILFINGISHLGKVHQITTICMNYDISKDHATNIMGEYIQITSKPICLDCD